MWEAPRQAEEWGQGWGCRPLGGESSCESFGLGTQDARPRHQLAVWIWASLFPTWSSDLGQCYGTVLFLGFLKALGVKKLGPQVVVAMTTISVKIVTKETVAMTTMTRYKRQVIGYQFCVETDYSLLPPSIAQ